MSGFISANLANHVSIKATDSLAKVPIAGIARFSTVDYPGKIAAVFFTQGCPWKCAYCHNAHLQPLQGNTILPPAALHLFLQSRKGLLDAIVISGGEPTLHPNLKEFSESILNYGYILGLHTNGMNPTRLKALLPLCQWVGMDVKAPRGRYAELTNADAFENVSKSAECIIQSSVEYELRMTYHPSLLSENDVLETAEYFSSLGAKTFILQLFRKQGCVDEKLQMSSPCLSDNLSEALLKKLTALFLNFSVRTG